MALAGPAFAAGGAASDAAGPASQFQMAMTIYAGGITLGKMDIDATVRGSDYHAVSNLQTSGVVNAFWQAEIQATSSGKVSSKNLTPVLYDSFDINRTGKKQEVSLTYDSANPPRLYADPPYSTTGYEVKPEDQKATLDPLSAVMFIVSGAGTMRHALHRHRAGFRRPPPLQYRNEQGEGRRHQDGQWPLCRSRHRSARSSITSSPASSRASSKANESFPTINAWVVTYPSADQGQRLCGAAPGLGRYALWPGCGGGEFAQDRRASPESKLSAR